MSAFVMDYDAVNRFVKKVDWKSNDQYIDSRYYRKLCDVLTGTDCPTEKDCQKMMDILIKLNNDSVNSRYNESDKPEKCKFTYDGDCYENDLQVYNFLNCFLYQSCECDQTKEYKALDKLKGQLAGMIVSEMAAEKCAWGE